MTYGDGVYGQGLYGESGFGLSGSGSLSFSGVPTLSTSVGLSGSGQLIVGGGMVGAPPWIPAAFPGSNFVWEITPALLPGVAVAPVDLAPAVTSGVAGLFTVEFFAAQLPSAERWMTGFDPATPGYIKVYETDVPDEWTKKPVKVWDGSVWVIKPMKFPNQYGFYRPTS